MTKPGKLLRYEDRIHKLVLPGQKVPLKLSHRECELILEHALADDDNRSLAGRARFQQGVRLFLYAG
jgi:hypothetical protein